MRAADLHRLARTLRDMALDATGNTGPERVNAGELAVLEDIARHPRSTIGDVTARTGLAQSLVSRIVQTAAKSGAVTIEPDQSDRRRVRVELAPAARAQILVRAENPVDDAVAAHTPGLSQRDRKELLDHLAAAAELLRRGVHRGTP